MYCMNCGEPIRDEARFCPKCGEPVAVTPASQNKTAGPNWTALVAAFANAQGEKKDAAFTALYNASYRQVYAHVQRYARNEEKANDAVQNAYIACWTKIDQLENATQFLSWIKRIAYNEFLSSVRKDAKVTDFGVISDDEGNETPAEETYADDTLPMPEDAYANEELQRLLMDALDELAEAQRIVMKGYYYESKPVQMLADELGIPVNTVKTNLSRGRKNLAAKIGDYANAYGLKLVPVAIVPFMAMLAQKDVYACEIAATAAGSASVLAGVKGAIGLHGSALAAGTSAAGATTTTGVGAASAGAGTAASTGAGAAAATVTGTAAAAGTGIAVKVGAGVLAAAVAAGGAGAYVYTHHDTQEAAIEASTEAASEADTETAAAEATQPETSEETISAEDKASAQRILNLYMSHERMWEGFGMGYYVGDVKDGEGDSALNPVFAIADLNGDGVNELWTGTDSVGWNMNLLPSSDTEYWYDISGVSGYNPDTDTYLMLDLNGYMVQNIDGTVITSVRPGYDPNTGEFTEQNMVITYDDDWNVVSTEYLSQEEYDELVASHIDIADLVDAQPFTQENIDALTK